MKKYKINYKKLLTFIITLLGFTLIVISVLILFNKSKETKSSHKQDKIIQYNETKGKITDKENTTIKISSVGNIIFHGKQITGAKTDNGYDFNPSFQYIKDELSDSDLTLGTVEGTLNGSNFSGFPNFNAPDETLDALKNSGIDIINYASNHILDKGSEGFRRTIEVTENKGIDTLGVRNSSEDDKYIIKEVKGHKIGFISYAYETQKQGETRTINSIPIPSDINGLINTFNYGELDNFYNDIKNNIDEMKSKGAEFIITSLHWGEEYITTENETQRAISKELSELGVNLILGGHPHVIQPYEIIKNSKGGNTFVIYSQGNFLSNQSYEELSGESYIPDANETEDGIAINFTLEEDETGKLFLKEYEVIPTWIYREPKANGLFTHRIIPLTSAIENKETYNLPEHIYERAQRSLERTKNIVGEIGVQSFPN